MLHGSSLASCPITRTDCRVTSQRPLQTRESALFASHRWQCRMRAPMWHNPVCTHAVDDRSRAAPGCHAYRITTGNRNHPGRGEICRKLDGLPLATSWPHPTGDFRRKWSTTENDQRISPPSGGYPERQRTMHAAIVELRPAARRDEAVFFLWGIWGMTGYRRAGKQ